MQWRKDCRDFEENCIFMFDAVSSVYTRLLGSFQDLHTFFHSNIRKCWSEHLVFLFSYLTVFFDFL